MKKLMIGIGVVLLVSVLAIGGPKFYESQTQKSLGSQVVEAVEESSNLAVATFAGGCFWCMEPPFDKLDGVYSVVSGYTGGHTENPSYEDVLSKTTGHVEAVRVEFNPEVITYDQLLQVFWRQIDPTDDGGQFVDRGEPYLSAIFYHNEEQMRAAEQSKAELAASGRFDEELVTTIEEAQEFYVAEEYHQKYYLKNEVRYAFYRSNSGRDAFLDRVWGEDRHIEFETSASTSGSNAMQSSDYPTYTDEEMKEMLSPMQYKVTQEDGTEPAFDNIYWNHEEEGIYVDIVSGEPLFSSTDKFHSSSGWPSFTQPLVDENIVELEDRSFFMVRTEIRSKHADSHLGHVFSDGPEPTGLRYCMNSAAMKFVAKDDLEAEGYAEFMYLFEEGQEG